MEIPQKRHNTAIQEIKSFSYPKLYTGKEWYIGFYAFDPARNEMRRKRIKLNHIEKIGDRRRYADGLMKRLISKLDLGWNPWIESENEKAYKTFAEACDHYRRYITKMFNDSIFREDTYTSYISYLRNLEQWNLDKKISITYIYQFDKNFINNFLEHIYIERNNTAQTRNNYLAFLRTFSSFLISNQYLQNKPTDGLSVLSQRKIKKGRINIEEKEMIRLAHYLNVENKYFLLSCYILHYCFIRPKEMSLLKIEHISIAKQTIYIPSDNAKSAKDGTVTLPTKIIHLMLDLNIFDNPGSHYLFSEDFKPGKERKSEKQFRDYWSRKVRKDLKLPATYKFYSLKDTGITNMLRKYDSLTVRDQARHSDIQMTDKYTPHDIQKANSLITNHEGIF